MIYNLRCFLWIWVWLKNIDYHQNQSKAIMWMSNLGQHQGDIGIFYWSYWSPVQLLEMMNNAKINTEYLVCYVMDVIVNINLDNPFMSKTNTVFIINFVIIIVIIVVINFCCCHSQHNKLHNCQNQFLHKKQDVYDVEELFVHSSELFSWWGLGRKNLSWY